jgi:hypothetical protein
LVFNYLPPRKATKRWWSAYNVSNKLKHQCLENKLNKMTPRELRMDGDTTPTPNVDKSELIEKRIRTMQKVVTGWNAVFEDEEIPFKLKLVLYDNEEDFNHLTKEDYHKVIDAPRRVNMKTEEWYSKLNY